MTIQAQGMIGRIEALGVTLTVEEQFSGGHRIGYLCAEWPAELSPLAYALQEPSLRAAVIAEMIRQGKATARQQPEEDVSSWRTIRHRASGRRSTGRYAVQRFPGGAAAIVLQ